MQYRLNKKQINQVCKRYKSGESSLVLSKEFGISPVAICGLLERRNIPRRPQYLARRKCYFDENVFDTITPEVAYWIGFIFADGSIFEQKGKSPIVALALSDKDGEHVTKFKNFFKSSHKIINVRYNDYKHSTGKRFAINSRHLAERLKYFGWNGKLMSIAQPELAFSPHFWRGVIDGDGWIGITKSNYPRLELVGGYPLLSQFAKYTHNIVPEWKGHIRPHKSIFVISFGGKMASKIIYLLYHNAPVALDRKYNASLNILALGMQSLSAPAG